MHTYKIYNIHPGTLTIFENLSNLMTSEIRNVLLNIDFGFLKKSIYFGVHSTICKKHTVKKGVFQQSGCSFVLILHKNLKHFFEKFMQLNKLVDFSRLTDL